MYILPLAGSDLHDVAALQPAGWPDIVSFTRFYLQNIFCMPVKAVRGEQTAGTAARMSLGDDIKWKTE